MAPFRSAFAALTVLAASLVAAQPAGTWTPLNASANALPFPVASDMDAAGNVYVIEYAPGAFAPTLARWDGTQWTTLPGTFPTYMHDLAVTEAGDAVYVTTLTDETVTDGSGTAVSVARVARYHIPTATWDNLDGGLDDNVRALDTDGAGNLIAGGLFTATGAGLPLQYVGRWNQAAGQWEPLGGGLSDVAWALVVEPGGGVVVAGEFSQTIGAGGGAAGGVARYDFTLGQWQALGTGFDAGARSFTGVVSDGTAVVVAGQLLRIGGVAQPVYRWDGAAWSSYASIGDVSINPIGIEQDGAGTLYVRGFTSGSTVQEWAVHARVLGTAGWTLAASVPYAGNVFGTIAANPNRAGPDLFLGGQFFGLDTPTGTVAAAHFARWTGSAWTSPQPPFVGTNGTVYAAEEIIRSITITPPSTATAHRTMAVGGDFSDVAGRPANRIALYDGVSWDDPGEGVTDPAGVVHAILSARNTAGILFRENRGMYPPLVIGGTFDEVTNEDGTAVATGGLARWSFESETWDPMGQGVRLGTGPGTVHALAHFPGCSQAAEVVYVGGQFDTATNADGSTVAVRNLARYNLTTERWEGVEGGTDGPVHALKLFNGRFVNTSNPVSDGLYDHVLVVSGRFSTAFDQAGTPVGDTRNVAWLDHEGDWHPMGRGTNGPVFALEGLVTSRFPIGADCLVDEISDFAVYVGGAFTSVNGPGAQVPASNLAKWERSGSNRWEVMGLPFGGGSGTPGNGVNGTVRTLQIVEGLTDTISGPITLAVGGDFTEAYDEYGATIASPSAVRLVDHEPTRDYPIVDLPSTRGAELYASIGGGTDGPVEAVGSTTCRVQVGSFIGDSDTYYVGGRFGTVGGTVGSPGLAKWRDFLPPPPPVYTVSTTSSPSGSGGGGGIAVGYLEVLRLDCPAPSLGRSASGATDPVVLGSLGFGEVLETPGATPPPDTALRFEITEEDGTGLAVDTVFVERTGPVAFLLTGVDDPGAYAPNPDGRDVGLGVRPVQIADGALAPPGQATVRVVNAVTDAPPLDVTLSDGTALADSLAYDRLGTSVRVPLGTPSVEVRRHDDGTLLGTFSLTLTEATAVQVIALAGFLDPAANQDGPPLTLIAVPMADEGAVASDETPAAGWTLAAPAPNPASARTSVRFAAPDAGEARVDVVDVLGRRVAVLHDGPVEAGTHTVPWDASGLASGVYLVRLRTAAASVARPVTVVR